MTVAWRRLLPSWPLIVGLAAFARAVANPKALLGDPDTYLHLAAGRWMIEHRAMPSADPFSHSLAGAHWVIHEWLSEVVMAAVYAAGGWRGLVLLTAACFALGAALLTRGVLRRAEPLTALILAMGGVALFLPHLLARAHILALPVSVAWCAALFAARDEGKEPPYAVLPLMLLWANLYGGFMFGLALAAYLALEAVVFPAASRGRLGELWCWAAFVLLAAALSFATPNGIAGFLQPIRMAQMPVLQATFNEWQATDFSQFQPLELWILGPILLGFTTGVRLPLSRLALVLVLIHLALVHARHADLLGFVGPLAVAGALGPQIVERMGGKTRSSLGDLLARLTPPAPWPALGAVVIACLLIAVAAMPRPITRGDDDITPLSALDAAEKLGLSGPVFNSEAFGGYLIFRGVPSFIDGRIEMYGDDFLKSYMAESGGSEPALTNMLARYHIAWTLLLPGDGAAGALDHLAGWKRVYADKWAVVHTRTDGAAP